MSLDRREAKAFNRGVRRDCAESAENNRRPPAENVLPYRHGLACADGFERVL